MSIFSKLADSLGFGSASSDEQTEVKAEEVVETTEEEVTEETAEEEVSEEVVEEEVADEVSEETVEEEVVTEIAMNQYFGNKKIERFTIPETISKIGKYAFMDCVNMVELTLPDFVEEIGHEAFGWCENLVSINYRGITYGDAEVLLDDLHANNVLADDKVFIKTGLANAPEEE